MTWEEHVIGKLGFVFPHFFIYFKVDKFEVVRAWVFTTLSRNPKFKTKKKHNGRNTPKNSILDSY